MNEIYSEIAKYAPSNWTANSNGITSCVQLAQSSLEFETIKETFQKGGKHVKQIKRVENLNAYGQFLVRQQFMAVNEPTTQWYKVRRYVIIKGCDEQIALDFQVDKRRMATPSVSFKRMTDSYSMTGIVDDKIVLIVTCIVKDINAVFDPVRSYDFYIEYILYF